MSYITALFGHTSARLASLGCSPVEPGEVIGARGAVFGAGVVCVSALHAVWPAPPELPCGNVAYDAPSPASVTVLVGRGEHPREVAALLRRLASELESDAGELALERLEQLGHRGHARQAARDREAIERQADAWRELMGARADDELMG